jgi:hypothetical protein
MCKIQQLRYPCKMKNTNNNHTNCNTAKINKWKTIFNLQFSIFHLWFKKHHNIAILCNYTRFTYWSSFPVLTIRKSLITFFQIIIMCDDTRYTATHIEKCYVHIYPWMCSSIWVLNIYISIRLLMVITIRYCNKQQINSYM